MNEYIATFYSHFGALSYSKGLKTLDINYKLMPVPRSLSASCGTCVFYTHSAVVDAEDCELDSIYIKEKDAFSCVLKK